MKTSYSSRSGSIEFLIVLMSAVSLAGVAGAIEAKRLRCEYATTPTAIATAAPRLSWEVEAGKRERGVMQSAYQVRVASSPEFLHKNTPDLWDSGKVSSRESLHIKYEGKTPAPGSMCYWSVKVWDQTGAASDWSEPARWIVGPGKPEDWKAKWIGYEPQARDADAAAASMARLLDLTQNSWVWAHGAKAGNQPAGKVYFRKVIQLPEDRAIKQATFLLTADDGFQLFINGHPAAQGSTWKTLATPDVTGRMHAGANALGVEVTNGGSSPTPAGLIGRLVVVFASGEPMVVPIDESWQTSAQAGERWSWADYDGTGWQPASAVAKFGAPPWGELKLNMVKTEPAPFFRKKFQLTKTVKHAAIFASALGVYELRLNGKPVDRDVFSPGWTDYRKRVHYMGYDVTRQLQKGENTVGAILGDGWYAGYLAFTGKRQYYGEKTRFIAQLHVQYADGSTEVVGTDASWKATTGPIREGDMLMGCLYDARQEMEGWDTSRFQDSTWSPATADESVKANLEAHPGAPIRRIEEIRPLKLTEPTPGVYVFDLGQNIVGFVRLQARGAAGQKVVVRHAEMLNPDGTLYTVNLRAAKATDTFLLAGGKKRAYEPYFTFHGFQYVEVTGLDYKPDLGDVVGVVVHSDLPRASEFECSEPLVNKLTLNSLWGQKGNFLDVPTDCPQRDERAGWTGDAQVFMKTACFNMDAPGFYTKWLVDLCEDSQRADGGFGDVAPHISIVSHGNTGWTDAGPVCNWQMLQMYGDHQVLRRHYPALLRHMDYLAKTSKNFVRGTGAYGDWLRLAGPQHSEVIGTAYYFYTSQLMTQIAEAIGEKQDAEKFRTLAGDIRTTFAKNFILPDGRIIDPKIKESTNQTGQTFYALAWGLDLVPEEMKAKTAAHFVDALKAQQDHIATGFLGTPFILFALQKAGHPELAYKLVLNKTYPGWLQQVIWGSTTMWERWDGWRPDKGFQDPGMNSFNHYWLGCVSEWLITQAAGLDTAAPGFGQIRIKPVIVAPGTGFDWVKASYNSIRGKVSSSWKRDGERFELNVTVPGNTTATIFVPTKTASVVKEGGRSARESKGVKFVREEGGQAVFEVGSGEYRFQSAL